MEDVLEELTSSAQMVVIDTPPLLAVTDAAILGAKVDGVVLVAAVNETSRDAVKRATAILEPVGARLLGVIVNKAKSSGGYYYAGYYGEPKDGKGKKGRFKRRRPKVASRPVAKAEESASRP